MTRKIIVYSTDRELTTKIVLGFAQGISRSGLDWEVRYQDINKFKKSGLDKSLRPGVDAVASLGILRGTGEMFRAATAAGIDYYYMDHAYFDAGYSGKGWMRIVKNHHTVNYLKSAEPNRYNTFFAQSNPLQPWQPVAVNRNKIVICPPTDAVSWYTGLKHNWGEMISKTLKSMLPESEHNRIVIREKPNEPIVDNRGNLIEMRQNTVNGSLNEDLKTACCVIAYNSMVAVSATLKGIPVIVSNYSCCKPIGFDLSLFSREKTPAVFNIEPKHRQALMYWLANNQWNLDEIRNGTAWRMLQENYNGI